MKNKLFTKSTRVLIVALILIAVLIPRELSQKLMIAAALLWLVIIVSPYVWALFKKIITGSTLRIKESLQMINSADDGQQPEASLDIPVTYRETPPHAALSKEDEKNMLLHISLRLSEKIKSAYPQATWQWLNTPALSSIFKSDNLRITVENMAQYTHADITFDSFGRIHIEPLIIGSFQPVTFDDGQPDNEQPELTEESPTEEPEVVDVSVWYQLVGHKILDKAITELNAQGFSKLTIKENGDIVVTKQKKEHIQDTLEAFPPKQYWDEFATLLADEYQLTAKNLNNKIAISWL